MLPHFIFWILLFIVCACAVLRGRTDERIAAGACAGATLLTHFVLGPLKIKYAGVEHGLVALDVAMLAIFIAVALRSSRFWPLWVAGLQLTTSMAHLMKAVDLHLMPRAYAAAAVFWSYPILLIILIACWRTGRHNRLESRSAWVSRA
jgi:hypothetical protein